MSFNLTKTALIGFSFVSALWLSPSPALAQDDRLTVYVAKKIITMDTTNPEGTAVAVRGKRVVAVGSMEDLAPWLEEYPHEIDRRFADKVLMPGLIDPHLHPLLGAIQLQVDWLTP